MKKRFLIAAIVVIALSGIYSRVKADSAPATYSAYTGTDAKTIPTAPSLGPANSVFTDPTFGSRILRVTDANTNGGESLISTDSGFHRTFNADSSAIKLTGPHGDAYWLEFNPSTFKVGDGSSKPTLHPLSFSANWEWSAVDPNVIYFLHGSKIGKYNKSTGATTDLGGPANGDPVTYYPVVLGQDNWVCAAAGSGIQDSFHEIFCIQPNNTSNSEFIDVQAKTINGVLQTSANWPIPTSGQTIGIHDISGGTGASWLEVTFHQASWGANGNAVLDISKNTWSLLGSSDAYWSGHVSMGNGRYANSSGSKSGTDSRGIILRDGDNLMNASSELFVFQPTLPSNGWCDADHTSWLNSMTNPNAPILTSRYTLSTSCNYAWTGEIDLAAVDGSNTVWRFAHNHNGGMSCYYAQSFAQISNDGKWALFSSYWDGALGPDTSFGCSTRIDTFLIDLTGASASSSSASTTSSTSSSTSSSSSSPASSSTPPPTTTTANSTNSSGTPSGTTATTTATTSGTTTTTRIEDTATSAIAFTGGWGWHTSSNSIYSGGTATGTGDAGARATLTFSGTGATFIGYEDEYSGIANIYIDGVKTTTVDMYSHPLKAQANVYSTSSLSPGIHTLAVEVTGTKNASSGGSYIWVDAFDVTSSSATATTSTSSTTTTASGTSTPVNPCSSLSFVVSNNIYYPMTSADLQTAFNCAAPGSTIVLQTTTPYAGSFQLPNQTSGSGWVTVTSGSSALPAAGARVGPSDLTSGHLAQLQVPAGAASPVLYTAASANHYQFIGIAFSTPQWVDTLVLLGSGSETATSQLPHHFTFDRCFFAGSAGSGTKHGLTANAGQGSTFADDSITVENSYFQDFKDPSNDAQAINVWDGGGPFLIQNNYMEASGENLIFGGADPTIQNLIPTNVQILRNHFYKPLSWLSQSWRIKNLLELKNAKDVTIKGNVFQNNWIQADELGWAVVLTPRNQNGNSSWSTVQNVTFQNNLIENSVSGFDLLGTDYTYPSGPLANLTVSNNLLLNINPNWVQNINPTLQLPSYSHSAYPGLGQAVYLVNLTGSSSNGPQNVTFTHNTGFQSGATMFSNGPATSGFVFTANVFRHNECTPGGDNNCGIAGGTISGGQMSNPTAPGVPTLSYDFAAPYNVANNILADAGYAWSYPASNVLPASAGFGDPNISLKTGLTTSATPNYGLNPNDPSYSLTPDNTPPGVNWQTLSSAIQGVVQTTTDGPGAVPGTTTVPTSTTSSGTATSGNTSTSTGTTASAPSTTTTSSGNSTSVTTSTGSSSTSTPPPATTTTTPSSATASGPSTTSTSSGSAAPSVPVVTSTASAPSTTTTSSGNSTSVTTSTGSSSTSTPPPATTATASSSTTASGPSTTSTSSGSAAPSVPVVTSTGSGSSSSSTSTTTTSTTTTSTSASTSSTPTTQPAPITVAAGQSLTTPGAGSMQVGSAEILAAPGQAAPSGLAIFGYRQNGILVSEAGVPATTPVLRGRVYTNVSEFVNTGVAIANPNGTQAVVSFYFTDTTGTDFGNGSLTIPAHGQIGSFLNQDPFNAPESTSGTFTFTSSVPVSAVAISGLTNERSEFLVTTLPVANPDATASGPVFFPHFADGGGWTTQFVLVNPTDQIISGTLNFYGQGTPGSGAPSLTMNIGGTAASQITYSIPPRASQKFATPNSSSQTTVGTAQVIPSPFNVAPVGVAMFSFKNAGITVSQASTPSMSAGSAFRMYAESDNRSGTMTGVAIDSTGPGDSSVSFTLTGLDGTPTGLSGQLVIPSNGQRSLFMNEIPGFESLPMPFKGVLRISSANPDVTVLGIRSTLNQRGDFIFTTTPPINESAPATQELIFPHIVDGGGYTTQFIMFSGAVNQPSSGNLQMFSQSGSRLNVGLQ